GPDPVQVRSMCTLVDLARAEAGPGGAVAHGRPWVGRRRRRGPDVRLLRNRAGAAERHSAPALSPPLLRGLDFGFGRGRGQGKI
ncbi:hypothetical protein, partial [Streptomyces sp. NPDC005385]|uniref:hypothetical protein n=1 Tax=Streptomyces sp. NPDC005385 TaxID=3157039 RepID=UPI0033B11129